MFNVIDLFCGCGGLSKGFSLAGYNICGGIDFNSSAIESFKNNFNNAKCVCCDLLNMNKSSIKNKFGSLKDIDVVIGGPPCQGFSTANRYNQENEDPRNKLFFQFMKFVDLAKPKAIVIENVRGIVTMDNGYAKDRIYSIFESYGYTVNHKIINAADYGVPQNRLRNFFVMTNKDKPFDFSLMYKASNRITVDDAIGELYGWEENDSDDPLYLWKAPNSKYRKYLRANDNSVYNHEVRYPAKIVQKRISYVPQGGNWRDVPNNLWPNSRNNRHSSAYKRLKIDELSCTIDTGNNHSNYFHPIYNRIPTVREAARLQSFPDNFIFYGNRSEKYRQVGNAVPPLLAKEVATVLGKVLDGEV